MHDDRLAAELNEIKHHHRQHVSINFPAPGICVSRCAQSWPCETARAAAALDALLKRADDWDNSALGLLAVIDEEADANAPTTAARSMIAATRQDSARELREAISRALLGEAGNGD
jgi:hypothetical protein